MASLMMSLQKFMSTTLPSMKTLHLPTATATATRSLLRPRITSRSINLSTADTRAAGNARKEDIVIVGAGIAGLAMAVALKRLGIGSVVLEQAPTLRTGGTSLSLSKNGWKVLDALGVGNELRSQFLEIQGVVIKSQDGRELRKLMFKDVDQSQELRAVERKILLETLANQLPPTSISYSSKLKNIEKSGNDETVLTLEDDSQISAKIVIACDGIHSPVAKWMGFREPKYAGHITIRGLGVYPEGQPFEPKVNYIYGRGVRAAHLPVSTTKVYWFVCFNSPSPGPRTTDPSIVRQETEKLIRGWSPELLDVINSTPDDTIIRTPLVDRWLWPRISPPVSSGNVVLVGDAWHPMTPNLGQGACCALEDTIVLAKKLGQAIRKPETATSVEDAFKSYEKERWPRLFPLAVRSNLVGAVLQNENPMLCSFRDNVLIPKMVNLGRMMQHTNFDFEPLV